MEPDGGTEVSAPTQSYLQVICSHVVMCPLLLNLKCLPLPMHSCIDIAVGFTNCAIGSIHICSVASAVYEERNHYLLSGREEPLVLTTLHSCLMPTEIIFI